MSIKKRNIKGKFTMLPNSLIERNDLTWEAKGVLFYLISKPSNWHGHKSDIKAHCPQLSDYAYKKIISELIQKDFIAIRTLPNPLGKGLGGSYYELGIIPEIEYEEPDEINESAND